MKRQEGKREGRGPMEYGSEGGNEKEQRRDAETANISDGSSLRELRPGLPGPRRLFILPRDAQKDTSIPSAPHSSIPVCPVQTTTLPFAWSLYGGISATRVFIFLFVHKAIGK